MTLISQLLAEADLLLIIKLSKYCFVQEKAKQKGRKQKYSLNSINMSRETEYSLVLSSAEKG